MRRPPPPELRVAVIVWARELQHLPQRGAPWKEDRVLHGLYIADLLKRETMQGGLPHWIARIDVRNVGYRDRIEITLTTEDNTTLQWGRSARAEYEDRLQYAGEAQKLALLRKILAGEIVVPRGRDILLFEPLESQLRGNAWVTEHRP